MSLMFRFTGLVVSFFLSFLSCSAFAQTFNVPASTTTGTFTISWTTGSTYSIIEELNSGTWAQVGIGPSGTLSVTKSVNGNYSYRQRECSAGRFGTGCVSSGTTKTITVAIPPPPPPSITPGTVLGGLNPPTDSGSSIPVGSIDGNFRVDESGSAVYDIPIAVPQGVAGVAPQLSVNYKSKTGNGLVGIGGNITGISSIARCRQTLEQDGKNLPITWTTQDPFCLDGQRLMLVNNVYGANEYKTEIDSFVTVTARGFENGNGSPDYFEVRAKDGSLSIYGGTADAKVKAGNNTSTVWAISRFQDSIGSQINYVYEGDNNSGQRVKTIYYAYASPNSSVSPNASVQFIYEARPDMLRATMLGGYSFTTSTRLKRIESYNQNTLYRQYHFNYDESLSDADISGDDLSRLSSVKLCVDNNVTCYPATRFNWGKKALGFQWAGFWLTSLPPSNKFQAHVYMDINGDGRPEMVWVRSHKNDHHQDIEYARFSSSGMHQLPFTSGSQQITYYNVYQEDSRNTIRLQPIDYNADGRQDLLVCKPIPGVDTDCESWNLYLSLPQSNGAWLLSSTPIVMPFRSVRTDFADFNADGLIDAYTADNSAVSVYYMKKSGAPTGSHLHYAFETSPRVMPLSLPAAVKHACSYGSVGDITGDGLPEFFCPYNGNAQFVGLTGTYPGTAQWSVPRHVAVYINQGDSWSYRSDLTLENSPTLFTGPNPDTTSEIAAGFIDVQDINSDGLGDVLLNAHPHTAIYFINTGTGFTRTFFAADMGGYGGEILQLTDVNRDGYTDAIWKNTADKQILARTWNNNTQSFNAPQVIMWLNLTNRYYDFSFNDVNGDGFLDAVEMKQDSAGLLDIGVHRGVGSSETLDSIYKITNGYQVSTEIKYGSLAESQHYTTILGVVLNNQSSNGYCGDGLVPYFDTSLGGTCVPQKRFVSSMDEFYNLINAPFGAAANPAPIMELVGPMPVVVLAKSSNPTLANPNNMSSYAYHYHHARMQAGGRGNLGFEKLTVTDLQTGIRTETEYHQAWPLLGSPKTTRVRPKEANTNNDIFLSLGTSTWNATTITTVEGKKRYQVFLTQAAETSFALQAEGAQQGPQLQTVETQTQHDTHGNALRITATTRSGNNSDITTIVTDNEYAGNEEWHKRYGRLSKTTVTTQVNGGTPSVRTSGFEYYDQYSSWPGLLRKEIPQNNQAVTTEYIYDAVGNKKTVSVKGYSNPLTGAYQDRFTNYFYDASNRYSETTVDALGNTVAGVIQRDAQGRPLQVRDVNGTVTQVFYNAAGQEYQRRDATGAWTHIKRSYCSDSGTCPAGAFIQVDTLLSGGGKSTEYLDKLLRVMRSKNVMLDGRESLIDTEYDAQGRVLRKSEPYFNSPTHWSSFEYDLLGRVKKFTGPDGSITRSDYVNYNTIITNALNQTRTEERNGLGQLAKVTDHLSGIITYTYSPTGSLESATTIASGKTVRVRMCYDNLGRKIAMHDPDKGGFLGNADASCDQVIASVNNGNVLSGWWGYRYNYFGELIQQFDAKRQVTTMDYDLLGRMVARNEHSQQWTYWFYDNYLGQAPAANTRLKLTAVVSSYGGASSSCSGANYCQTFVYDSLARLSDTITYLPNVSTGYINSVKYDAVGRVYETRDAMNGQFTQTQSIYAATANSGTYTFYNEHGYAMQVNDIASGDVLQKTLEMNARGQVTRELRHNGGAGEAVYTYDDATGALKNQKASVAGALFPIQDVSYEWDTVGNLKSRWNQSSNVSGNARKNLQESFCYDGLNRLVKNHLGTLYGSCSLAPSQQDMEFDGLGNIIRKSGLGVYTYSGQGPHAVSSINNGSSFNYDANGNQLSSTMPAQGSWRTQEYTSFDMVKTIYESAYNATTRFRYGPDHSRFERIDESEDVTKVTHYLGNIERTEELYSGIVEWKRYVAGAIYTYRVQSYNNAHLATNKSFVYNDHLGSLDVIVNANGQVTHTQSFDAWGKGRNGETWTSPQFTTSLWLANFSQPVSNRGYTGHEMLDTMGLIHMNGRVYDPTIARFIQADPFIQAATNTQSYNRYSYTLNNPLNATDPSGYYWQAVAAVAAYAVGRYGRKENKPWLSQVASVVGCLVGACVASTFGATYGGTNSILQAGISAVFAYAGGQMGNLGFVGNFLARGVLGGASSAAGGGDFATGFLSAGISSQVPGTGHAFADFVVQTTVGGTISAATGGKFRNGALSSAFAYAVTWGANKAGVGEAPADSAGVGPQGPERFDAETQENIKKEIALAADAAKANEDGFDTSGDAAIYLREKLQAIAEKYDIEIGAYIPKVNGRYIISDVQTSFNSHAINTMADRRAGVDWFHTHQRSDALDYFSRNDIRKSINAGSTGYLSNTNSLYRFKAYDYGAAKVQANGHNRVDPNNYFEKYSSGSWGPSDIRLK